MNLVPIRIVLYSNYDCINSHYYETSVTRGYHYYESYMGAVIDALKLNPKKVKDTLNEFGVATFGRWPNKSTLNGKELISYEDFWIEEENRGCPACNLVIVGMVDKDELNKEYTTIKIPKGNCVGYYSADQGGGSCIEAELINDTIISIKPGETEYDRWALIVDDEYGYSIEDTFGVVQEFFGKEIKLNK